MPRRESRRARRSAARGDGQRGLVRLRRRAGLDGWGAQRRSGRREREAAEESARFKAECAQASHELLAAAAEEARANPPQAPELSGRDEEMLLNGAYLVRRGDERLRAAVAELEDRYGGRGVSYE